MAPSRHNPARRAARAPLQERYRLQQAARRDAAARASGASATSDATTPRTSLDASAEPFDPPGSAPDEVNLPPVDLRDDPDAADEDVFALSCYGGAVRSLTQVVRLDRFTRLASLCVHGCRLTRLEADPALRACAATLVDLNLSSNRIAALEGLPHLPNLRALDVANNRLSTLAGLDEGAPKLERLAASFNRVRSLHALTTPRADGEPWALAHLDLRSNNVETFADVAAGLAAVVSLRTLRLASEDRTRPDESLSDADDAIASAARGTAAPEGNPVCAMPSYRQAIAALAPWVESLDEKPLSRAADDLREGSNQLRAQIEAAERRAAETETETETATETATATETERAAAAETDASSRRRATDERSPPSTKEGANAVSRAEPSPSAEDDARARRAMGASGSLAAPEEIRASSKTPKIDAALRRYKARAGEAPEAKDAKEAKDAPSPAKSPGGASSLASSRGGSLRASASSPAKRRAEKEPKEPPNADAKPAVRVVREIVKEDPAVIDHEVRLRRIERSIAGGSDGEPRSSGSEPPPAYDVDRVERVSGELRALKSRVAAMARERLGEGTRNEGAPLSRRARNEASRLRAGAEGSAAAATAARGRSESDDAGSKPPWRAPNEKDRPAAGPRSGPPTKRSGRSAVDRTPAESRAEETAEEEETAAAANDPEEAREDDDDDDEEEDGAERPSSRPSDRAGGASGDAPRARRLERELEDALRRSEAQAEAHAAQMEALKEDHAKFVAAMNVALSEANAARDAAATKVGAGRNDRAVPVGATVVSSGDRSDEPASRETLRPADGSDASERTDGDGDRTATDEEAIPSDDPGAVRPVLVDDPSAALAATFKVAVSERDAALAARDAAELLARDLERTLAEVRAEASENISSMRAMHAAELSARDDAVAAADGAAAEARDRVVAVEEELRALLKEEEAREKASGAKLAASEAECEEMTRVARSALASKSEAEQLAEELAEVCEQQRRAVEELSRDRRRADRAEADVAAMRADVGEMTRKLRDAEKRCAAAKASESAAKEAFDAIKDEKVAAHAATAEIGGVRKQLELATDNVRIKDAMLQSQAELIASLKGEASRAKDAAHGAVKAAADAERAADAKSRRLEDDLRRESAAVDRLEKALEETREAKAAAEEAAAEARREVEERDGMLGYVGAEVESVKAMFASREEALKKERDELAALVAERDEVEAAARNAANAAKEEAARAKAEAAEAAATAHAKAQAADEREAEARESVRRIEGEMRALLSEVAQQKRKTRELGNVLQTLYN